ncbi:hypothetical protein GCM10012275_23580 [Longimycelium tulufanense]|uniref:WXG100 family type VII secretion target n=1 Tax=Longimycelium tulufanense TaxID=907463 RepID=A0A8J3CDZ3_9PSEU|nr:hypothetical protein [Longimycelium tulufanense]GGM51928.1 hypothetical protein GCM10012275_23580 [Longimycelium tulufanense]
MSDSNLLPPGGFWDTAASNAPGPVSSGYKTIKDGLKIGSNGDDAFSITTDVTTVVTDATSFVTSCGTTAASIATDPLGWLINQGLGFLLNAITPLKEALHYVTGDPDALKAAGDKFTAIGNELVAFGREFVEQVQQELADWEGPAAQAAKAKLARFGRGVSGTADHAGDIARLLQTASIVAKVVEEFIRGLLTELVEWLIVTWLAALAAAPVTFGGSTAAAGAATTGEVAVTTAQAGQKISKVTQLLNKIREVIAKLQRFLKESKLGQMFMDATTGKGGKALTKAQDNAVANATERAGGRLTRDAWRDTLEEGSTNYTRMLRETFGDKVKTSAGDQLKKMVGLDKTSYGNGPGEESTSYTDLNKIASKATGYAKDAKKIYDTTRPGENMSDSEIRRDLEF